MELKDLTGQQFGRLTVIKREATSITPNGTKRTMWLCQCVCGKTVIRSSQNLRNTPVPSCGCYVAEKSSKRRLIDLTGMRFGRLTVVGRTSEIGKGLVKWHCKCDCGNECDVIADNLRRLHTISCGCYREEIRPTLAYKHGMRHTRIYDLYDKIKDRCYNPNNPRYERYGGRGITMCDEWYNDRMAFFEWAYKNGYDENAEYGDCTIDRIDNNKGYSPDNCRFVDIKVQSNNRATNLIIEHNGEKKTLAQWRDYFGMTQWQAYKNFVVHKRTIQDVIDNGVI